MRQYLLNLNTTDKYNRLRFRLSKIFENLGLLNDKTRKRTYRLQQQPEISPFQTTEHLRRHEHTLLRTCRRTQCHRTRTHPSYTERDERPELLHIHTVKGRGFAPAEEEATICTHRDASTPRPANGWWKARTDCRPYTRKSLERRSSSWPGKMTASWASRPPCPADARWRTC